MCCRHILCRQHIQSPVKHDVKVAWGQICCSLCKHNQESQPTGDKLAGSHYSVETEMVGQREEGWGCALHFPSSRDQLHLWLSSNLCDSVSKDAAFSHHYPHHYPCLKSHSDTLRMPLKWQNNLITWPPPSPAGINRFLRWRLPFLSSARRGGGRFMSFNFQTSWLISSTLCCVVSAAWRLWFVGGSVWGNGRHCLRPFFWELYVHELFGFFSHSPPEIFFSTGACCLQASGCNWMCACVIIIQAHSFPFHFPTEVHSVHLATKSHQNRLGSAVM